MVVAVDQGQSELGLVIGSTIRVLRGDPFSPAMVGLAFSFFSVGLGQDSSNQMANLIDAGRVSGNYLLV